MASVKYISPDGTEVEVPDADATFFDEKGWERADGGVKKEDTKPAKKTGKNQPK